MVIGTNGIWYMWVVGKMLNNSSENNTKMQYKEASNCLTRPSFILNFFYPFLEVSSDGWSSYCFLLLFSSTGTFFFFFFLTFSWWLVSTYPSDSHPAQKTCLNRAGFLEEGVAEFPPSFVTNVLCDLKQVSFPFWGSVSLQVERDGRGLLVF